ncbi:hypothetical protein [Pseudoalteromonas sp. T1lg23B]|nr:hypothetical protein [Pseudoalteromonas sp. T1lg23B]
MKLQLKKKAVKSLSTKEKQLPKEMTHNIAGASLNGTSLWTAFCEPD